MSKLQINNRSETMSRVGFGLTSFLGVLAMLGGSGQTNMAAVWEVVQTYQNPMPEDGDWAGKSIATVGDYVVVGVNYHDIVFEDDGAAYLFNASSGELLPTFHNPDPHERDHFGAFVAAVGNNILIGAPSGVYAPAPTPGFAYLFDTSGNLLHTFNNPDPNPHDGFGYRIAATSDTVAISAPNDDTKATTHGNTGAVYLFDAAGSLQHRLYGRVGDGGDYFGSSVAAVGDNILVGAGGSDEAAYLFDTSGNLLQTFENPMGPGGGHFGQNVAFLGDDVLIDALDGEHAYLFDSDTGDVVQTLYNPIPGETFGHAIAGVGENVFVGAPSATMHLFDATSGDLLHTFDNPGGNIGAPIVIMGNGVLTGGGRTTYLFAPIPEPSTFILTALDLLALLGRGWRRRRGLPIPTDNGE